MVTKRKSVGVVTEGVAQAALRRGPARELSPEEDKVLRMRLGAAPARGAPLERAAEGLTDLEIEVYAAEIEAYMKWKARQAAPISGPGTCREATGAGPLPAACRPGPAGRTPDTATRSSQTSRTKEKIVRALRKL